MPTLRVEGDDLVVAMSTWERAAAFHGDVRVPVGAIQNVAVEPDPWGAIRGIRAPGTGFPRVIAYGVRRRMGDRPDFVAVLRNRPAVRVELGRPSKFARLVVSVDDPQGVVRQLRGAP
jgi:hypothetical protein